MRVTEHVYDYAAASSVAVAPDRTDVVLGTSGGPTAHPHFFSGHVLHGGQTARALLLVAEVAATRFHENLAMLVARKAATADPVVTSGPDVLRFESFSRCGGVYARLDLDAGSLDADHAHLGTTNIDAGPAFRTALRQVGRDDPIHLEVGLDEVRVRTLDGEATERRVALPDRWVKGFGEVPAATAGFVVRAELSAAEARRLLESLPGGAPRRGASWAVPSGRGLRLSARATPEAVCLAGPQRLRLLDRVLADVRGLRVYGPAVVEGRAHASAWEVLLDDARLVLVASADASRGFSGDGGVLDAVAGADDGLVDRVEDLATTEGLLSPAAVAPALGTTPDAADRALRRTAAAGLLGHDLGAAGFFPRRLPFDPSRLAGLHPRLAGAHALVAADAVTLDGPAAAFVTSRGVDHRVSTGPDGLRCTCPWYGRHAGARGPCKHVLAVQLARQEGTP